MKRTPLRDFIATVLLILTLGLGYLTGGWTSVGAGMASLGVGYAVAREMRGA